MSKEKILTVMVPIRDGDCESGVYTVQQLPSPSAANINKIYKIYDGTYRRLWYNPANNNALEYYAVTDREFPYLGKPMEIGDFTYDATRMGQAPTISAQGVMWYADYDSQTGVYTTLEDLWASYMQECFVMFDGKRYHLKQIPTCSKSNEDARYKYDIDFVWDGVVLENVYLYDVVSPFDTAKPVTESSTFSFFGDVSELAKRINASLIRSGLSTVPRKYVKYPSTLDEYVPYLTYEQWNQMMVDYTVILDTTDIFADEAEATLFLEEIVEYTCRGDYNDYLNTFIYAIDGIIGYQCKIGNDKYGNPVTSEEKLIAFDKNYIYDALQEFHNTFDLQYYIVKERGLNGSFTGNTIIWVADCEHDFADWDEDADDYVRDAEGVPVSSDPLDYPKNAEAFDEGNAGGLLFKEKTNTTDKIITRITGVGSSENIPWFYPNPTADGWIKPALKTLGVEQTGVVIDYPTSEGDTIAENVRYEKYLKNRIGNHFAYGIVMNLLNVSDFVQCRWSRSGGSGVNYREFITADYNIQNVDIELLSQKPDDWDTNYSNYYKKVDDVYVHLSSFETFVAGKYYSITPSLALPKITLEMALGDSNVSTLQKYTISMMNGDTALETYDSSQTYENPTPFQEICRTHDGLNYMILYGYGILKFRFRFEILSLPETDLYDVQGYYIPAYTYTLEEHTELIDDVYHEYQEAHAYIGADFYEQGGLQPYVVWNEIIYPSGDNREIHVFTPQKAGYSTDGTAAHAIEPIGRVQNQRYQNLADSVIYRCNTSFQCDISNGDYQSGDSVWEVNAKMTAKEWLNRFVDLKLRMYAADSWYLGSKAVVLADYGINSLTQGGNDYTPDIFDTIEFSRVKYITPQPNLMPEVYIKTDGERRFYNAHNYLPLQDAPAGGVDAAIGEKINGSGKVINNIYKENETDPDDKHYVFENEYIQSRPHEHIEDFEDIKPTIREQTITIDGQTLRIDVMSEYAYDATDNDEIWESNDDGNVSGEYKHPYFFAKLRPLGFNIFDLALQEDMVITMETGHCGACNFRIAVDEKTRKNTVQIWEHDVYKGDWENKQFMYAQGSLRRYVDEFDLYYDTNDTAEGYKPVNENLNREGGFLVDYPSTIPMYKYTYSEEDVANGLVGSLRKESAIHFEGDVMTSGRYIESLQDTSDHEVWIALYKDTDTYGVLMPSARPDYSGGTFSVYIRPKSVADAGGAEHEDDADKFAILNIKLPQVYLRRAERKLSDKLVNYMYENNMQKFNSSIKFSRIYFKDNAEDTDKINENSVLYVRFNNKTYRQYVKHYTYRMSHEEPLPEVNVDMNEELPVTMTSAQRAQRAEKNSKAQVASTIKGVSGRVLDNTQAIRKQEMYPSKGSGSSTPDKGSGGSGDGGAQAVAVQPDWAQTDVNADDYIKNKPVVQVTSGEKLYLNGTDVTSDPSMEPYIAAAIGHWYGSQDAYNEIVADNEIVPGTLYHILTQADWDETDQSQLGYIKNKPNLRNVYVGTCATAGATAAKEVSTETFPIDNNGKPLIGTSIGVKFDNTNTATNPTLNVNGTGAASIWYSSSVLTTSSTHLAKAGYANRYIYYVWDGTYWVFFSWSIDANDFIGIALATNYDLRPVTTACGRRRILFSDRNSTHWIPANSSTSTSYTVAKTPTNEPINPFGRIVFYNSTNVLQQGDPIPQTTAYDQCNSNVILGYSFTPSTLTFPAPLYIKCHPQSDGMATIDGTTPYVQTLPSSEDGCIYIHIGNTYSATNLELVANKTVYYHDGDGVKKWTGDEMQWKNF